LRVLFIDDHEDLRNMMRLLLERQEHEVKTAATASSALELASDFCPHLIVSDIGLPEMNGYDLMAHLRAKDSAPFRSIAMTGFSSLDDKEKAIRAGFDACLTKPVDFSQLFRLIEELGAPLVNSGGSAEC
jgi:CheY-like chemotaxis protein